MAARNGRTEECGNRGKCAHTVDVPKVGEHFPRDELAPLGLAFNIRERDVFGASVAPALWPEDIEFLMADVWGRRCAHSPFTFHELMSR